ncbi:hypothetical protein AKJ64_03290 [candidate division MSBL1 archaeon SCGC-AAA259E17]|uniref:Uncharacterized protein n=1 Tax=candidate division MSBL1 archaeon SCGC-AAA259E17 TaxID=1698263 RepID=A0A133UDW2_9EURY|nr:hypothetical protein AKJ64_03290 [candidate division MSBL1 archaeon SCGC-AAA259E17]
MTGEKVQIGSRVSKELNERVESIAERLGWGGKQKVVERALEHYVNSIEGDLEQVPVAKEGGILLTLNDIRNKLSRREDFTATNITPFSPPVLEKLGEMASDYMEGDEPDKVWVSGEETYKKDISPEIDVDDVREEVRKGEQIRAVWGTQKRGDLLIADRELLLNPR